MNNIARNWPTYLWKHRGKKGTGYFFCAKEDSLLSYEIATLPPVARNDNFIFNILTESVTELLS